MSATLAVLIESDELIISHIRTHGSITNKLMEGLYDVLQQLKSYQLLHNCTTNPVLKDTVAVDAPRMTLKAGQFPSVTVVTTYLSSTVSEITLLLQRT